MTRISSPAGLRGLIPTNVAGAYLSPPPPPGFSLQTATEGSLLQHGVGAARSLGGMAPAARKLLQDHLDAVLAAGNRFIPRQVPRPDIVHRPPQPVPGASFDETTNWGGGVLSGTWSVCNGKWNVPTVSRPNEAAGADGGWNASTWIGLDGSGSNDVLQAGVEQDVDSSGNASYYAWYEWYCAVQKRTLGDTSPMRPALAALNGRLYIAWVGNGNNQLNVMVSSDRGQSFSAKLVSVELSASPPALCGMGGALFVAWTGVDNNQLNVAQVALDGNGAPTSLSNKVTLQDISPDGPSLASIGNTLYLGWIGQDNEQINISLSTDNGQSFGAKHVSAETSPHTPALASAGPQLFVAWKGDGNDQLNVAFTTLDNGAVTALVNKVVLGDTSPFGPSMASVGTSLYLAWRGDGNDQLNISMSDTRSNLASWDKYVSGETSTDAPALAQNGADLFIGWKGDGNDNLNVSLVGVANGLGVTGFSTPAYLGSVEIANFPVSPGDTVSCAVQYVPTFASGQISFANSRTGQAFSITLVPPPGADMLGNSAEWIVEVPTINGALAHLPAFTPVTFNGAAAATDGTTGNPDAGTPFAIDDDDGVALTSTVLGDLTVSVTYVAPPG